jgi:Tfp pilus assembly protein PilZ
MEERRRLHRRHILFYSRVFDRKTGVFLGYLGNMNEGGLMIISDSPISVGEKFLLRIDLPEDIYSKTVLNFEAKSVWCRLDVDPNFHNTGFQLVDISDEGKGIIAQIVDDYGFRD